MVNCPCLIPIVDLVAVIDTAPIFIAGIESKSNGVIKGVGDGGRGGRRSS